MMNVQTTLSAQTTMGYLLAHAPVDTVVMAQVVVQVSEEMITYYNI